MKNLYKFKFSDMVDSSIGKNRRGFSNIICGVFFTIHKTNLTSGNQVTIMAALMSLGCKTRYLSSSFIHNWSPCFNFFFLKRFHFYETISMLFESVFNQFSPCFNIKIASLIKLSLSLSLYRSIWWPAGGGLFLRWPWNNCFESLVSYIRSPTFTVIRLYYLYI